MWIFVDLCEAHLTSLEEGLRGVLMQIGHRNAGRQD